MRTLHDLRSSFGTITSVAGSGRPRDDQHLPQAQYLNVDQAAAYLGTTVRMMRRLAEQRRCRFTKVGRELRWTTAWLDAYAEAHAIEPEVL